MYRRVPHTMSSQCILIYVCRVHKALVLFPGHLSWERD